MSLSCRARSPINSPRSMQAFLLGRAVRPQPDYPLFWLAGGVMSLTLRVMEGSVDNDVYDRLGGSWWDETSLLNVLHGSVTPGRFAYFRAVLARQFGTGLSGLRVLDIGCGGGFLAEEFAALGCRVTGVDPSPASIGAARAHAAGRGLRIDYRVGGGEELPGPDAAFGG